MSSKSSRLPSKMSRSASKLQTTGEKIIGRSTSQGVLLPISDCNQSTSAACEILDNDGVGDLQEIEEKQSEDMPASSPAPSPFDDDEEVPKAPAVAFTDTDRKLEAYSLAKRLNMPGKLLQPSVDVFLKHAVLPEGHSIFSARLEMTAFMGVLADLCTAGTVDCLSEDYIKTAFRTADRDGSGDIDVEEFAVWYSSHCFDKELSLTAKDIKARHAALTLGIDGPVFEKCVTAFNKFDTDGSGLIEKAEFQEVVQALLKVPAGTPLPEDRVAALWREADSNGNGEVDFEEFIHFYQKHFDEDPETVDDDPLVQYYKSYRRVSVYSSSV
jgi:Ca2+-binding EF-hand superfamily protein